MTESIKAIIFLVIFGFCLAILAQMWRQVRSYKLKKVATKYRLSYSKNYKFYWPDDKIFNVIIGEVNGQTVKIFDSISSKVWGGIGGGIYSYRTILQINGVQTQSKEKHFARLSYIEDELKKISQ